jgi:hypothetical protein
MDWLSEAQAGKSPLTQTLKIFAAKSSQLPLVDPDGFGMRFPFGSRSVQPEWRSAVRIEAVAGLVVLHRLPNRFDKQSRISGHIEEGAKRELYAVYNF